MKFLQKSLFIIFCSTFAVSFGQNIVPNKGTGEVTEKKRSLNSACYANHSSVLSDGKVINFVLMDNKANLTYAESLKDNLPRRLYFDVYNAKGEKIISRYRTKNLPYDWYVIDAIGGENSGALYGGEFVIVIDSEGHIRSSFYPETSNTEIYNATYKNADVINIFYENKSNEMKKLYKCEWNTKTNEKKTTLIRESEFSAKVFFSVDVNDKSVANFETIQHSFRKRYDKEKSMNIVNRDGSFLVLLKTSNWYDSPSSTSSSTLIFRQNMNAEAKSTDIENLQLRKILCITETPEGYGILVHGKYEKNGTLSDKSLILLRIDKKGNPIALTPVIDKNGTSSNQLKYIIENCVDGFGEMIYNDAKGTLTLLDNSLHKNNFYTINFKL